MPGHYGGSHSTSSSRDTGSDYGQFDRAVSRAANNPTPSAPSSSGGNNNNYQDRIIQIATTPETVPGFRGEGGTDERGNVGAFDQRSGLLKSFDQAQDSLVNYMKSGGLLGVFGRAISPISASMQAKAMEFTLNRKIKSRMGDLDLNNPNTMKDPTIVSLQKDLQGVKDGTFKQSDYTKKYGSGDATNPLDASFNLATLNDNDRQELENLFAPELSYAVGGTAPQASMVNQYFSNLGNSNLGISSNYTNTYNQAKANIAKSLNMTPNTQQYGYMPNRYSNYSRSMTSANPFFDELTEQGLI